ncbi:hypothetical protein [Nocardioides convexus]|uniref:hypothetical protein n=1 Tax=Nocardioides convexus TaxID=2712224 RepID=UPI002418771E|nr:hypothetical protein [Nocardioides convexus]
MSTTANEVQQRVHIPLVQPRLPRVAPLIVAGIAVALALLLIVLGTGVVGGVLIGAIVYLAALPLWSLFVEGRRGATDRMMTGLIWATFLVAVVPLVSLLWRVISKGAGRIDSTFLSLLLLQDPDRPAGRRLPRHHRHLADHHRRGRHLGPGGRDGGDLLGGVRQEEQGSPRRSPSSST